MNNKKLLITLAAAILLLAAMLIAIFALRGTPDKGAALSASDFEKEITVRDEDPDLEVSLIADGQRLLLDKMSNTFYMSVDPSKDLKVLPGFKAEGMKDARVLLEGGITPESIAAGEKNRIAVVTDSGYRLFDLVTTTLPLMSIDYSGDIDTSTCDMNVYLYDNSKPAASAVTASKGTIRYRGASTLFYPKKSFKIELSKTEAGDTVNNNVSLLDMRTDDDWILYAAYNDCEKVRDVFCENLWWETCAGDNSWGVKAGMCYRYVELILNGEYYGLYALGFQPDEKQFGLSGDCSYEALYKKKTWDSEDTLSVNEWGTQPGYESKTDNEYVKAGYEGEFGHLTGPNGDEVFDMSEYALLYEYYLYLAKNSADSKTLLESIDIDNAIDLNIFFNLIQAEDTVEGSLFKNQFIAVRRESADSIKVLYAPWDMDISWGNKWIDDGDVNFTVPYYFSPSDNFVGYSGYLEEILINGDTDTIDSIVKKYRELRSGAWSVEKLDEMIDGLEKDIFGSGAFLRDMERWPGGIYEDPSLKLSAFREYVHKRLESLDGYYDRLSDNKDSSIYLRRSLACEGFEQLPVFISISDRSLLENKDFAELIGYVGADISKITDDIVFVAGSASKGFEYYDSYPSASNPFKSPVGEISLQKTENAEYWYEDEYTLFLNGLEAYNVRDGAAFDNAVAYEYHGRIELLDLKTHYDPAVMTETFKDNTVKDVLLKYGYTY